MTIELGTTDINKVYGGSTEYKKSYLGSTLLYNKTGGSGAPDSSDCELYYKMENTVDAVGNADLTINGATSAAGIINNGYQTDGINDSIDFTHQIAGASGTDDFSISMWTKTSATGREYVFDGTLSSGVSTNRILINFNRKGSGSDSDGHFLVFTRGDSNSDLFGSVTTNPNLNDGNWHHFVFVRSGLTGTAYIDGAEWTDVEGGCDDGNLDSSGIHTFGMDYTGANPFAGTYDEVSFFNVALTSENVTYLYNSGAPGSSQQYPFT